MIDLEHLPRYEDGFYLLRFNLDKWDIDKVEQILNQLQKILRMNDIYTPLIAVPDDIMLTGASKEELLQIRAVVDKAISDMTPDIQKRK